MPKVKIKLASGLIRQWINLNGLLIGKKVKGWTSFWNTIYIMNEKDLKNKPLIRHEMKHIEQINKDGILLFSIKYMYYSVKLGYQNNLYEIEARKAM